MTVFFVGFVSSLILTALLVPYVKKLAFKIGAVDKPSREKRKIHTRTIARGGGISIYIAFVVLSLVLLKGVNWQFLGLLIASTMVLLIGLADDIWRLSPWLKLAVQTLAALVATVMFGIGIDAITNPFGNTFVLNNFVVHVTVLAHTFTINYVASLLAMVWLIAMTNTMNFLDGLDGLSGGVAAIAAFVIFLVSISAKVNQPNTGLMALILAGGCLGYLFYNFYPAKIFNGDSGAYFLGMTLGILSIISGAKLATAALVLGLPILDALWAVTRRLIHGQSPFRADRGHLHYLLLDVGLSQRQAVFIIYSICVVFGGVAVFAGTTEKLLAILALVIILVILLVTLASIKARQK
ncbi:undecaprenyl/decaprenyl-phosphate alpha-N-acetylglucosaminyl 1-phosphate transferase [Candidatus Saccharibacteria bacterium]|nr:undecaprenyl/decaprenyl-phosphate alpha-N-acetylglucosaminyl 1-phosphate transferase [Candidatus Saccharibacteria bacterium]